MSADARRFAVPRDEAHEAITLLLARSDHAALDEHFRRHYAEYPEHAKFRGLRGP